MTQKATFTVDPEERSAAGLISMASRSGQSVTVIARTGELNLIEFEDKLQIIAIDSELTNRFGVL